MASFRIMFGEEYNDLVEDTKITTRGDGFHFANTMLYIGGGESNT